MEIECVLKCVLIAIRVRCVLVEVALDLGSEVSNIQNCSLFFSLLSPSSVSPPLSLSQVIHKSETHEADSLADGRADGMCFFIILFWWETLSFSLSASAIILCVLSLHPLGPFWFHPPLQAIVYFLSLHVYLLSFEFIYASFCDLNIMLANLDPEAFPQTLGYLYVEWFRGIYDTILNADSMQIHPALSTNCKT